MGLSGIIFCLTKMSRRRGFNKKRRFCPFVLVPSKNFQLAAIRTILTLEPLPMAHLKAYVPNFPKRMWKRSQCRKLWVLALSEVGWSRIVGPKNAVFFGIFWEKMLSHGQTRHFWPHSFIHIQKAEHLRIPKIRLKFDFQHPVSRQIFGDGVGQICTH